MPRRVLSAELGHETNTFSILPTTLESYHSQLYYEGDDIARAMVTEDQDDAEGDLLAYQRQRVGADIPIAITLDLHANVSDAMAEHANIVMAYRTYPHIDQYEIATEAADLMERAMAGEINPRPVVARGPLVECNHGLTQEGPMINLLKRAAGYVADDPIVLSVAVCAGFSLADIPFMGPTVTVVGDGDDQKFGQIADAMMDEGWDTREDITVPTFSLADAMTAAQAGAGQGGKPLVLTDFSDNPGSGGSVRLLEAMIHAGLDNAALGVIADPDAVTACQAAGAGNQVTVSLGSKVDATLYGPPLELTATAETLNGGSYVCDSPMLTGEARSMGPTVELRMGGLRAIVASNNQQVTDRQVFISQGIEPAACDVVAVKSAHHFRAAFQPPSRDVMLADSGSLATRDLDAFPWHKLQYPVYPLNDI